MAASLLLGGAIRLAIFTVSGVLFSYFSSPRKGVGGIPTIPFWVALMPLVKDVDQQDVFTKYIEKPLRKHGAASVIFAGQWNVLIHKPAYLAEVFRREDIYQKSGNYSKIPRGVLAALLGDNIISSHGEPWKKYKRLSTILVESQALPTDDIQGSIQRHTIACCGNTCFNVDLDAQITKEIFTPLLMNFPFLDRLPFPSRTQARRLACHLTNQLLLTLEHGTKGDTTSYNHQQNKLCTRLLSARDSGELTEKQFRDNVTVLFVAGQENPQLAILSTMYLLAKHQLINRRLASVVHLGDTIFLPEGTYVGYNCYSTNRDPDAWGQDADAFRPSR
ncbi:Cytochrome P450-DIT2 [Metarhizium anisopliae]